MWANQSIPGSSVGRPTSPGENTCGKCGKTFYSEDVSKDGRSTHCPKCGNTVRIKRAPKKR